MEAVHKNSLKESDESSQKAVENYYKSLEASYEDEMRVLKRYNDRILRFIELFSTEIEELLKKQNPALRPITLKIVYELLNNIKGAISDVENKLGLKYSYAIRKYFKDRLDKKEETIPNNRDYYWELLLGSSTNAPNSGIDSDLSKKFKKYISSISKDISVPKNKENIASLYDKYKNDLKEELLSHGVDESFINREVTDTVVKNGVINNITIKNMALAILL